MPAHVSRRGMLQVGAFALGSLALPIKASSQSKARIVIVGGGFGGASAAQALVQLLPSADFTLIEPNASYTACPFSNLVIVTERPLAS